MECYKEKIDKRALQPLTTLPRKKQVSKSLSIYCTKNGIKIDGANNIGSTSDAVVSTKRNFLRVCECWWNTYCGGEGKEDISEGGAK